MSRCVGLVLLLGCATLGCARMKVAIDDYDGPFYDTEPEDCRLRFVRSLTDLDEVCEYLALVRVRDTGATARCGSDRVRFEILYAACRIGGNTAILERKDSVFSTCVQADAAIFNCRPVDATSSEPPEPPVLLRPAPPESRPVER